jgi:hypothetical protein
VANEPGVDFIALGVGHHRHHVTVASLTDQSPQCGDLVGVFGHIGLPA